jgi:hypothetical protein
MTDSDVREFLHRMADESGAPQVDEHRVVQRARRRLVRTGVMALVVTVAASLGTGAVVRATMRPNHQVPVSVPKAGGLIAFVGYDGIYVIEPDRSGLRRLTEVPGCPRTMGGDCAVTSFAWSADGSRLAFQVAAGPQFGTAFASMELFVVDAAGGIPRRLGGCTGCLAAGFAWSPDGARIAFAQDGSITLVGVDDGSIQKLGECSLPSPSYEQGTNIGRSGCAGLA